MTKKKQQPKDYEDVQTLEELNQFVPRPFTQDSKRHMIAVDSDAYNYITETAEKLSTTRGRIVTALVALYREPAA